MYKSEPPVDVVKGLDEWLYSIRDTVGFDLIKEIALEEGNHGAHASEGRFTIGEALFKKGNKLFCKLFCLEQRLKHIIVLAMDQGFQVLSDLFHLLLKKL